MGRIGGIDCIRTQRNSRFWLAARGPLARLSRWDGPSTALPAASAPKRRPPSFLRLATRYHGSPDPGVARAVKVSSRAKCASGSSDRRLRRHRTVGRNGAARAKRRHRRHRPRMRHQSRLCECGRISRGMAARASRRRRAAIGARAALVRTARRRESPLLGPSPKRFPILSNAVERASWRKRRACCSRRTGHWGTAASSWASCSTEGVRTTRCRSRGQRRVILSGCRCFGGRKRREPIHSLIERLRSPSAPPNWRSAAKRTASHVVRCACEEAEGTSDRGNAGPRGRSTRCSIDLSHRVNRITRSVDRLTRPLRSTRWSCDPHPPMARVDRTRDRST